MVITPRQDQLKRGVIMKYDMLETKRLILKSGTYEDYLTVYEYDFTKLRNIAGEFEFVKLDQNKVEEYSKYHMEEKNNVFDFIIYLKNNMTPIGNVILDKTNEMKNSLEIAFNLHPNYWRNGYMTEAVIEIMKYIFNNTNYNAIIYGYAEDNYKSKGVNKKIGFEYYDEYEEYYPRFNKNIRTIKTIMTKDRFKKIYNKEVIING